MSKAKKPFTVGWQPIHVFCGLVCCWLLSMLPCVLTLTFAYEEHCCNPCCHALQVLTLHEQHQRSGARHPAMLQTVTGG